jgi:hypothetical protein
MTTPFPFVAGAVLTAAELNAITTLPINDQTDDYTLVVGDVGKRVIMNKATANTVTVDDSIFAAGDTIFIANKGAGTSTITAGAGVTINTSGSLALAQYGGGTLSCIVGVNLYVFSRRWHRLRNSNRRLVEQYHSRRSELHTSYIRII